MPLTKNHRYNSKSENREFNSGEIVATPA